MLSTIERGKLKLTLLNSGVSPQGLTDDQLIEAVNTAQLSQIKPPVEDKPPQRGRPRPVAKVEPKPQPKPKPEPKTPTSFDPAHLMAFFSQVMTEEKVCELIAEHYRAPSIKLTVTTEGGDAQEFQIDNVSSINLSIGGM